MSVIFCFILGACVASFVCALSDRALLEISLLAPRSQCFHCQKRLKFYHLVPVFSYLFLGGKCGFCKEKIPFVLFASEVLLGLCFALLFLQSENLGEFVLFALLATLLLTLSIVDIRLFAVPNLGIWACFILLFWLSFTQNELSFFLELNLHESFFLKAFVFAGGLFFLQSVVASLAKKESAMGEADIILLSAMASFLGLFGGFVLLFLSSFFALLFVLFSKKRKIPFLPFITLGFFATLFFGEILSKALL